MATIKEVAQRAGVSVTTVSRVLNKRGYISQEMHDKIYATMEELNYQPNEVARSLTRRRTKIIGLLVPSVDDPYFGEVVNQLILAAMRHGYKVMIYASDGQNDRALEYVGMLKANQVDGIIISLRSRELDALLDDNLPVVSFERIKVGRLPTVLCDNHMGGRMAAEELLASGSKRPCTTSCSRRMTDSWAFAASCVSMGWKNAFLKPRRTTACTAIIPNWPDRCSIRSRMRTACSAPATRLRPPLCAVRWQAGGACRKISA